MTTEMSETLEKIRQYIQRTPGSNNINYDLDSIEWSSLCQMNNRWDSIFIAFNYGRAKGYRAAKAEMRRKNNKRRGENV